MRVILDLNKYKDSEFVKFRKKIVDQAPFASATVDAEALYVRLAYMALRREMRQTDAAAIKNVQANLGSSTSGNYTLYYVCPPFDSRLLIRRKP